VNHKPNFFIVGAPKCGTTALSEYLREHPNVFMSTPKEPNFFNTDLFQGTTTYIRSLAAYSALFEGVKSHHTSIGEASVWYLYSKVALTKIREFNSEAKIIAMMRNPVDLLYSLHYQFLFNQTENETDFQKAWQLQEFRKKGQYLTKGKEAKLTQYRDIGMLGEQIQRLYDVFPKEQIELIFFDDFVASIENVYRKTVSFLGLPDDGRVNFPKINESKTHRYKWLKPLAKKPSKPVSIFWDHMKALIGIRQFAVRSHIVRYNSKKIKRSPLSSDFRLKLLKEFEKDIINLSKISNRDLSHWVDLHKK
jgi:hypothetical protein